MLFTRKKQRNGKQAKATPHTSRPTTGSIREKSDPVPEAAGVTLSKVWAEALAAGHDYVEGAATHKSGRLKLKYD